MTELNDRHLSPDNYAAYLGSPVPIDHPIPGTPRVLLFVDPYSSRVGLRGPAAPEETLPEGFENLTVRRIHYGGRRMIEIAVTEPRLFRDAYTLLCAIADRVQLDQQTMTDAFAVTLRHLGHLLREEVVLSEKKEIGLVGELLVLSGLINALGRDIALSSWRGGDGEEHDFGLSGHDLEVKTTAAERPVHWISSLTQLLETGARPLWLVSLQITAAGEGGRTLPEFIERLRALLPSATHRDRLDERLQGVGWRDRYASSFRRGWRLRCPAQVFRVTDSFPRLTPQVLAGAGVDLAYVNDVRYRLDLTGRNPDLGPPMLTDALARGEQELS